MKETLKVYNLDNMIEVIEDRYEDFYDNCDNEEYSRIHGFNFYDEMNNLQKLLTQLQNYQSKGDK